MNNIYLRLFSSSVWQQLGLIFPTWMYFDFSVSLNYKPLGCVGGSLRQWWANAIVSGHPYC